MWKPFAMLPRLLRGLAGGLRICAFPFYRPTPPAAAAAPPQIYMFAPDEPALPKTLEDMVAESRQIRALLGQIRSPLWDDIQGCTTPHLEWLLEHLHHDLHVVYSPGKVGSRTIQATLKDHPAIGEAYHLHMLSPGGLERLFELIPLSMDFADAFRAQLAFSHWMRLLLVLRRLVPSSRGRKTYVLSGVRDPVAMALSAHFESWWLMADSPLSLTGEIIRSKLEDMIWFKWCNDWYTQELGAVFQIDPFVRPFPRECGWDVLENDIARVLLLRIEDFERLPAALGALYERPAEEFKVRSTNRGEDKSYARHYRNVCATFQLPGSLLDQVYDLPFVRHFYSPLETERFKRRWLLHETKRAAA
jgi:hypothetical protein